MTPIRWFRIEPNTYEAFQGGRYVGCVVKTAPGRWHGHLHRFGRAQVSASRLKDAKVAVEAIYNSRNPELALAA